MTVITDTELALICAYCAAALALMGLVDGWLERRRQPAAPPPTNRKRKETEDR
jgi:hypothetical protein